MSRLTTPCGIILVLACVPSWAAAATSVPATSTSIGMPGAVITAPSGDLYFSSDPGIIFKVDAAGQLSRVAGSWTNGYSGDGGPAADAQLSFPYTYPELQKDSTDYGPLVGGLALDVAGSLYVADNYNNRVRKITPDGLISTIAGADNPTGQFTGTDDLTGPSGLAVNPSGQVYVAHWLGVGIVTAQGTVTPLVPYNCGLHSSPGICWPGQMSAGFDAQYYIADGYCDVRAFGPDGLTHDVAGNPMGSLSIGTSDWTCGYGGDGGPAVGATLDWPEAAVADRSGILYIADTYNHCIRRVDNLGIISTFAGRCGSHGYSGDGGPAVQAQLDTPWGVAVDDTGNVFIADTLNHRIRKVTPSGVISTVAGDGTAAPVVYSFKSLATTVPAAMPAVSTPSVTASAPPVQTGGAGALDLMTLLVLGTVLMSRLTGR